MISRRKWLLSAAAAAAAGCATPGRPLQEAFPSSVAGGWRLRRSQPLPDEEIPGDVRAAGFRRGARAEYAGPAVLTLSLHEMKSPGNAFELLQKWRPAEGRMSFQHGRYFGIVEGAPHPTLQRFIDAFDRAFGGE